ncbi:MAG: hypothetical protein Greene041619_975 [Candidatus Peregrinibacteria bacterium Greene0416_19]|nr:MAG: hypothetical protein Greene041619_975 [Candidatus Peregrinibacteria bacterium Greene0416_19]
MSRSHRATPPLRLPPGLLLLASHLSMAVLVAVLLAVQPLRPPRAQLFEPLDLAVEVIDPGYIRSENFPLEVRVSASGNRNAEKASATVTFDATDLTYIATSSDRACQQSPRGTITCSIPSIESYRSRSLRLGFRARSFSGRCLTKQVSVTVRVESGEKETERANNRVTWYSRGDTKCAQSGRVRAPSHTAAPLRVRN